MIFFQAIWCFPQEYQDVVVQDAENTTTKGTVDEDKVEDAARRIVAQIGLPQNFVLKASLEYRNNAVADMLKDENGRTQRYVIYDPNFFNAINDKADNDWAAISVLAHEIGHHLNNHSLNNDGSTFEYELLADEWSGFVLRKMGASLKDAQSAVATLKDPKVPSKSHPPKTLRMESIEIGWRKGQKSLDKFTAEDEITAEMIKEKYADALGGKAITTTISSIGYKEKMIHKSDLNNIDEGSNFTDIIYGYGTYRYYVNGEDFIKESLNDGTKYMLKEGRRYFKKNNKNDAWTIGYHPYMDNIYHELRESDVEDNIDPPTGNILKEILFSEANDSTRFNVIKTINGIPSYELETNTSVTTDIGNNRNIEINSNTLRYYKVEDGLLHFVLETKTETERKKNKIKYAGVRVIETSVEDYSLENNLLVPHRFVVKTSFTKNDIVQPVVESTRIISDFEINLETDETVFDLN